MDNQFNVESTTFSDDLRRYFSLFRHWAWLLILAAILAGLVSFLVSMRMTPVYQASTTLLINEAPSTRNADYTSILTSERLARTYSEMLTTSPVLEVVISELNLGLTTKKLQNAVQVQIVRDTQLIEVKVEHTDPVKAAEIANKLVEVFSNRTQALQASRYASSKQNLETQLTRIDDQIQTTTDELARLSNTPQNKAERDHVFLRVFQVFYADIFLHHFLVHPRHGNGDESAGKNLF